jgi:hypothetical protein
MTRLPSSPRRPFRLCACLCLAACATSGAPSRGGAASVASGGALVGTGARCHGGACTCREVDDQARTRSETPPDEGAVAEGHKRFEARSGRGAERLEVTVDGKAVLDKSGATVEASCSYLDLPPGEHKVHVRARAAKADEGMAPALMFYEHGAETHDWYQSFAWRCGGGDGPCKKVDLDDFAESMGRRSRGIFDPCGSARVSHVTWQIEHGADYRVEDLTLDFVLHVYHFVPRVPHGGTCKGLPKE